MPPTTQSLLLHPVTRASISNGGYSVKYEGTIPPGHTLWLGVPDVTNALDITGKPRHHVIDATNLPKFLSLIGNRDWWGKKGSCKLLLKQGGVGKAESNIVEFDCPVRPLVPRPRLRIPTLGLKYHELWDLKYAARDSHGHNGRFLHMPAIDGCYYFRNGEDSMFETDDDKRGLVCTSYIAAVWALGAEKNGPMTWHGYQIATHAGAPFFCSDLGMKDKSLEEVKGFLETNHGTFIAGSSNHVVLVVNGVAHDFTVSPRKGYNVRSVKDWHPKDRTWSVGKPLQQF